jgi:hypothetical protein
MRERGGSRIGARAFAGWGLAVAFFGALGYASHAAQAPEANPAAKPAAAVGQRAAAAAPAGVAGLSPEDDKALTARFEKEVWPLMSRDDAGCASCHGQKNASQFLMLKDPRSAFHKLLAEGHFDDSNHASIVARVTTTDKAIKMPPTGMTPWTAEEMAVLTAFAEEVQRRQVATGAKPDEAFPAHLLQPYAGDTGRGGLDNTFLSYRQLRGKVRAIFDDDWRREDRDLFLENLHLFGGADFVRRFDETTKAAPTFLTGVEMLGRDVASRAFLARSGPFAGFPASLPAPVGLKAPAAAHKEAIARLYRRMLFRDPTPRETQQAFSFLQAVYRAQDRIAATAPQDLRFSLTVRDAEGMQTTRDMTVRVTADTRGLYQEFVDQSDPQAPAPAAAAAAAKDAKEGEALKNVAVRTLASTFRFAPGDAGQKVVISNAGTHGNVSVHGITLRGPLPAKDEKVLPVSDPSVRAEGAWRIRNDEGVTTYEDNNENKGRSLVVFPVSVAKPGAYEVAVSWRRFKEPGAGDANRPRRRRGPTGERRRRAGRGGFPQPAKPARGAGPAAGPAQGRGPLLRGPDPGHDRVLGPENGVPVRRRERRRRGAQREHAQAGGRRRRAAHAGRRTGAGGRRRGRRRIRRPAAARRGRRGPRQMGRLPGRRLPPLQHDRPAASAGHRRQGQAGGPEPPIPARQGAQGGLAARPVLHRGRRLPRSGRQRDPRAGGREGAGVLADRADRVPRARPRGRPGDAGRVVDVQPAALEAVVPAGPRPAARGSPWPTRRRRSWSSARRRCRPSRRPGKGCAAR